ncbi:uncharacterized protein IUM83_01083 [Phytophthora cinnamomi]|uniref:uncharacterized protein n=1 Tax=Phytophthora cinnamomi TaxID=4785 RepID=UPI00355A5636|nr:hypothetical protein IUM83_01083 [Phytophthora cinnamomi]
MVASSRDWQLDDLTSDFALTKQRLRINLPDSNGEDHFGIEYREARVQSDMPQWNADKQRFVSKYYTTFDQKYRPVLDTVNMAAVEGALKYVEAECINKPVITDCKRKNNIKYVVFYQTTVVQPAAAMTYYTNATNQYNFAIEHCPFMPMDGGQCDPNADGSFPDVCIQYIGANGQPDLGFCVGGTLQDNETIEPYPHNNWFSFPNSSPHSRSSGAYIPLDDVVGITSMVNANTGKTYADYAEFCKARCVEFNVGVSGSEVKRIDGLKFWANPGDSNANAKRTEKLVTACSQLLTANLTTTDGGVMKPLPTVE